MEGITIDELKAAIAQLPPEFQKELLEGNQEVDSVAIKMELVKFVTELHKHNQGVDWETNKVKPKKITFDQLVSDAKYLYEFITE